MLQARQRAALNAPVGLADSMNLLDESGVVFNRLNNEWHTSRDMDVAYMLAFAQRP